MYVSPGMCFLAGIIVGVLGLVVAVVGIALYFDNKENK